MTFGSWADVLFADPEAHAEALVPAGRDDLEVVKDFMINNARTLGLASKVLFPVPDRHLADRLHRVRARTLLVWGERDQLIPPPYADAFKAGLTGARSVEVVHIPNAAHMSILEQPDAVAAALRLD